MTAIGYARVSTIGQSLDIQLEALEAFGCEKIFKEKQRDLITQRPQLKICLDYVREGDLLVITKLDRLARSTFHLHKIIDTLNTKEVGFKVLDQSFDTTTEEGKLMFSMLTSIAEFETELRSERQMEGIAKAKKNGIKFGRKSKLDGNDIQEMKIKKDKGIKVKHLMKEYNLSKASVYRLLKL